MREYVMHNGELYHYGVLGMKWGVRRGRSSSAFRRASEKVDKLRDKAVEKNLESAKARQKALKKMSKATSERKYQKARKLEFEANKLAVKAAKITKKAVKLEKKMGRVFSTVKLSDISPEDIERGRRYTYMLAGQKR